MKKIFSLTFLFLFLSLNSFSLVHTEKISINIETYSNECEQTILSTFKDKNGILNINFKESKLIIEFNPHQINLQTIYKWIIMTHNSDEIKMFKGTPKPNCCKKINPDK